MTKKNVSAEKALAKSAEATLAECAVRIRNLSKVTKDHVIKSAIEIGRQLTIAKKAAGHTHWAPWLEREFPEYSDRHARNFMHAYDLSLKSEIISDLDVTGLFLLAAPSTTDEARAEVKERAKGGKKVPTKEVREIIKKKAAPAKKAAKPPAKPTNGEGRQIDQSDANGNGSDPDASAVRMKAAHETNAAAAETAEAAGEDNLKPPIDDNADADLLRQNLFILPPKNVAISMLRHDRSWAIQVARAILEHHREFLPVEDVIPASSPPPAPAPSADDLEIPEGLRLRRTTAPSVQAEARRDDGDVVVGEDDAEVISISDLPIELSWTHPEKEWWSAKAGPFRYDANLNNDRWVVSCDDENWNERKLGSWKKLTDAKRHAQEDWNNQRQILIQKQGLRAVSIETANVDATTASLAPQGQENSESAA